MLPETTSIKDALTLQLASSAYCVPGVVLGASGDSNKENRNVSLKTQLPPKSLTCGASSRASVCSLTQQGVGRGVANPATNQACDVRQAT